MTRVRFRRLLLFDPNQEVTDLRIMDMDLSPLAPKLLRFASRTYLFAPIFFLSYLVADSFYFRATISFMTSVV